MHQNRLFNRTRIQLTLTYALVIGVITLLCGSAIHFVMIRAFTRIVDRELNTLAGTVHDTLETVLQQPEIIDPAAINFLPELCFVDKKCRTVKSNSRIAELIQEQGYSLRLLNVKGEAIATLGPNQHQLLNNIPTMNWKTITDDRGDRYYTHTLLLKTNDNRDWGYLQVAQSFHRLDDYMNSLHLILILGTPLAMLVIGGASWWLSGLAMQPIYQSYQQMQQFTVDAAHELRTPLAVTRIAVESALDAEVVASETRNNLEIAQRQVRHLSYLAEDLLWLSRLEAKQLSSHQQPCCLNDLVSDLEEELAPLAMANSIDLRLEILVDRPLYAIGDSDRLYRAISNLITNAIQYTPPHGVVSIQLESAERQAIIAVRDNGIGIASADLPHIFDRFYRVQAARSRDTGGTGLGLAIARAIVETHQGSIQVESKLDLGSIFTVTLPIKITSSKTRSDLSDNPIV